jgi:hypothetical protein
MQGVVETQLSAAPRAPRLEDGEELANSLRGPLRKDAQTGLAHIGMTGRLPRRSHQEAPGEPGGPIPPQRRRSEPIAKEDRLVVPDTLGTTIKLSFLEGPACLAPADCSQRGEVLSPIYRTDRRDVPRDPLVPGFRFNGLAPSRRARQGLGGWLRNVSAAGVSQRSRALLTPNICSVTAAVVRDFEVVDAGQAVTG